MIVVVSGIIGIWIAPSGAAAAASSSSASSQGDAEAQRPRTANSNQPPQEKTNKQKKTPRIQLDSIQFPMNKESKPSNYSVPRPRFTTPIKFQIRKKERKKERKLE